jgi:hypothetical protein
MKLYLCFAISLLAATTSAHASDVVDQCRAVAEIMGRDDSSKTLDMKLSSTVYENTCSGKQVKAGFDYNSSAATYIDFLPVKSNLNLSGRKEKAEYFCNTYNSADSMSLSQTSTSSPVVREAIEAWRQCVLANNDVWLRVNPTTSAGTFFFDLKRLSRDAVFKGVRVAKGDLTCTASPKDAQGNYAPRTVDATTSIRLTEELLSVSCVRGPVTDGPLTYLPETSFVIDTTLANLPVVIPQDASLGARYGTQLTADMQAMFAETQRELAALRGRTIQFTRTKGKYASMYQGGDPAPPCPEGYGQAFEDQFYSDAPGGRGIGMNSRVCWRFVEASAAAH